jgi:hypothetical protein
VFDWLFEGKLIVYAALAGAAVAFLLLWWQSRKRGLLIAAGVMMALIALVALLDWGQETDREQVKHRVEGMAASLTAHDVEQAFQYISDDFRTPRGTDKKGLRDAAKRYLDNGTVTDIEVWDIRVVSLSRQEGRAQVSFSVKLKPVREDYMRCEAVFDHDPARGWRLREFRLFNPFRNEEYPLPF